MHTKFTCSGSLLLSAGHFLEYSCKHTLSLNFILIGHCNNLCTQHVLRADVSYGKKFRPKGQQFVFAYAKNHLTRVHWKSKSRKVIRLRLIIYYRLKVAEPRELSLARVTLPCKIKRLITNDFRKRAFVVRRKHSEEELIIRRRRQRRR